jgi:hypothetical protein
MHSAEEIVRKLRRADELAAEGKTGEQIAAELEVSAATLYNWRRSHGGMDVNAAKELRELREQNSKHRGPDTGVPQTDRADLPRGGRRCDRKPVELHLLMDNYAAHKHQNVREWLAKHPGSRSTSPQRTPPG